MEHSHNGGLTESNQVPRPCSISIILSTQNAMAPMHQLPQHIKNLIPKGISSEIILVHYNQPISDTTTDACVDRTNNKKTGINQDDSENKSENLVNTGTKNELGSAFIKGIQLSSGQLILAMDADYPYPDEVIVELINELITSPNSIIIASRYANGTNKHRLPFIRNAFSKGARIIAKHGLKVKDVQDPLSGCFALSRELLEHVKIEGKGSEILLEILVKMNKERKDSNLTVKEIPFEHKGVFFSKKLDFNRIMCYSKAVWHLYRYGQKSTQLQNKPDIVEQKRHKSVLFLSKAGRFFTVGASGFFVNYAVSYLLANVVSNVWYLQATLVGIIVSITTNFLLNKVWTFEDRDFSIRHFFRQYVSFLALCSLGAFIQLSLVYVFVEYSHIQYGISLIMAVCVASLGNFLLNKKLTFGEKIWG